MAGIFYVILSPELPQMSRTNESRATNILRHTFFHNHLANHSTFFKVRRESRANIASNRESKGTDSK